MLTVLPSASIDDIAHKLCDKDHNECHVIPIVEVFEVVPFFNSGLPKLKANYTEKRKECHDEVVNDSLLGLRSTFAVVDQYDVCDDESIDDREENQV